MSYIKLPERTSYDLNSAADINQLQDNLDALIGGLQRVGKIEITQEERTLAADMPWYNLANPTETLDAATWGAELAAGKGAGRIYIVEPTGEIEDDPNVAEVFVGLMQSGAVSVTGRAGRPAAA